MSTTDGILYCPPDVDEAKKAWGANCGPAALAAVLGRPVMEMAAYFPRFHPGRCASTVQIAEAIAKATDDEVAVTPSQRIDMRSGKGFVSRMWPSRGVACLMFHGPWDLQRSRSPDAAKKLYKHAHWIGIQQLGMVTMVYDIHSKCWEPVCDWRDETLARVLDDHKSNEWWCRMGFEIPN
jgi:hypothetical protein